MMNPSEHESVIKLLIANHLRNKNDFCNGELRQGCAQ